MLFLTLLILVHLADASIRLQHSILYDEVDFNKVNQVTTDMCAAGCKIYATIGRTNEENVRIAQNIVIVDPNTQAGISVAELSGQFMQDSHEKAYLEIGNAPAVTIVNTNANRKSAPLSLWIVSANSPHYRTAEVFEPLNLSRATGIASAPITILSVYAFTVIVAPGDANAVFARAAGYDAIDRNAADNCYVVLDKDFGQSFPGFVLGINGPLLTLSFDTAKYPHSEVVLSASMDFSSELTLFPQQPTFISSQGFMCGSASHQLYRSSSLSPTNYYTLRTANKKEMTLNFSIDMDTDSKHPVRISNEKTAISHPFFGNFKDGTNEVKAFSLETYKVSVSFTPGGGNDFFYGMRVWTEEEAKTTTAPPEKWTTTSSVKARSLYGQTSANETTTSSTANRSLKGAVLSILATIFA